MITVRCPSCNKVHQAQESILGRRVQCNDCGTTFLVEHAAPTGSERPTKAPLKGEIDKPAAAAANPTTGPASDEPGAIQVPPSATGPKRPFGLVWVVIYWIISGAGCMLGGLLYVVMGSVLGGMAAGAGDIGDIFDSRDLRQLTGTARLVSEGVGFLGILIFHYGMLLMVACYGLWTSRRWGLSLARGLAVASVGLNVITVIITLITRVGIVASLVSMVISAGILVYLYGSANLRDRLQRYLRGGRLQGGERETFE